MNSSHRWTVTSTYAGSISSAKTVRPLLLAGNDRGARPDERIVDVALLQHPPVQQVEDVTRIEDLPDLSDADLGRMRAIRDEARQKNGVTPPS